MKKKNANAKQLKKKPTAKVMTPAAPPWDKLVKCPVRMFQTLRGPLMGLEERQVPRGVRIWAPAMVNMPTASNVLYTPMAFVEGYFDLHWMLVLGTNDIPQTVEQGYRGYLEHFIKGGYAMGPVVIQAGIEGEPHTATIPPAQETELLEKCPACNAELSNWQAHYPVNIDEMWTCEMSMPDIREKYPNYAPTRPSDA